MIKELNGDYRNIGETLQPILKKYTPGFVLTQEDKNVLGEVDPGSKYASYDLQKELGKILSQKISIGWTTTGHTQVDVNLYAFGPSSEDFIGNWENDALGRAIAKKFKLNLDEITDEVKHISPFPKEQSKRSSDLFDRFH